MSSEIHLEGWAHVYSATQYVTVNALCVKRSYPLALDRPAMSVLQYSQMLQKQPDSLGLVTTAVPASPRLLELAAL